MTNQNQPTLSKPQLTRQHITALKLSRTVNLVDGRASGMLLGLVTAVLISLVASATSAQSFVDDRADLPLRNERSEPFAGSFSSSQMFELPAFRSLTPSLGVTYSSARKNDHAGVGWSFVGESYFEAKGPRGGAPKYNNADVFWYDGVELIPCTTLGGTHCTKQQSYLRIVRDEVNKKWVVTGKDGTVLQYTQRHDAAQGTWRWYLKTATDTNGNSVVYSYTALGGYIYLTKVTYNGVQVDLYWESRPDQVTFPRGDHLVPGTYRLKSVDVKVGGQRLRAYALAYTSSLRTSRSLLSSVTMHGRNASVDAAGTVSGGTTLPPVSFQYTDDGPGFASQTWNTSTSGWMYNTGGSSSDYQVLHGDFNGDGKQDILTARITTDSNSIFYNKFAVELSTGTGFSSQAWAATTPVHMRNGGGTIADYKLMVADVNGDGKDDIVTVSVGKSATSGWSSWFAVELSTGTGFISKTWNTNIAQYMYNHRSYNTGTVRDYHLLVSDFDGDGKADIAAVRVAPHTNSFFYDRIAVELSTGTAFSARSWYAATQGRMYANGGDASYYRVLVADVNGDGRGDIVTARVAANTSSFFYDKFSVELSTGTSFDSQAWTTGTAKHMYNDTHGTTNKVHMLAADVNGDGMMDIVTVMRAGHPNSGWRYWFAVDRSKGNSFASQTWAAQTAELMYNAGGTSDDYRVMAADVNGDGLTDIVTARRATSGVWQSNYAVELSTGTSFSSSTWSTSNAQHVGNSAGSTADFHILPADVNGDGKTDFVVTHKPNHSANGFRYWFAVARAGYDGRHRPEGGYHDLLSGVTNSLGGTTGVTYISSSAWNNTNLPTGMTMPTVSRIAENDGRGGAIVTNHTYAGALWSAAERRFLGFRTAKTIDATGAYKEHIFTQNVSDANSTPEYVYHKDAAGNVYDYTAYEYVRGGNGLSSPYTSNVSASWNYACNGDTSCKRTRDRFSYDGYGNVTILYNDGDYDVTGDERTTHHTYYPNTTKYIVDFLARKMVFTGLSTLAADRMSIQYRYADGQAWNVAPTKGNLTQVLDRTNAAANTGNVWTIYAYDAYGNTIQITDPNGNVTETVYDSTHRLYPTKVTNAKGHVTQISYDPVLLKPTSIVDPNGLTTTMQYDALGRHTRTNRPDGSATATYYANLGSPTSQYVRTAVTDGSSNGWLYGWTYTDGLGRPWQTLKDGSDGTSANRRWTHTAYNSRGLVSSTTAPYLLGQGEAPQYTTYDYDPVGRRTRLTHPDGTFVRWDWSVDWRYLRWDEAGKPDVRFQDAYGQVVRVREWNNNVTVYGDTNLYYDALGRLVQIKDADGNITIAHYDSINRKLSMDDPNMGVWNYVRDPGGNLTRQTDARGTVLNLTYDATNRLLTKKNGTAVLASFTYDQARSGYYNKGRLTSMTDTSGSTTFDYDKQGRKAREIRTIDNIGHTFEYVYDKAGRLSQLTYPDGETVTYSYNDAGDMIRVAGTNTYVSAADYDAAGRLVSMTLGSGVVVNQTYNIKRGWLLSKNTINDSTMVDNLTFAYDAAGRLMSKTSTIRPTDSWGYTYDDLNRLTKATNLGDSAYTQTFTYNKIGNMLTQTGVGTYKYPPAGSARPHAPLSAGNLTYSYDANGNRLSNGIHSYTYNAINKLATAGSESYVYDGFGDRVKVGSTLLLGKLYKKTGTSATKYYFFNGRRVAYRYPNALRFEHGDHLETTRVMTQFSGGIERAQRIVSPFGQVLNSTGETWDFGLAGERMDSSGLYHMGARYQDPQVGQFTQPDPSGFVNAERPQTLNRYSYVYNNPIMFSDPTGYYGQVTGYAGIRNPEGSAAFDRASTALDELAQTMFREAVNNGAVANSGGLMDGRNARPDPAQLNHMRSTLADARDDVIVLHSNSNAALHQIATEQPNLLRGADIYAIAPGVNTNQLEATIAAALSVGSTYNLVVGQFDPVTGGVVGDSRPLAHIRTGLAAGANVFVALGAAHSITSIADSRIVQLTSPREIASMGHTMTNHRVYNDRNGNLREEYSAGGGNVSTTYSAERTISAWTPN